MDETRRADIRPANRQALQLLEAWLSEPDDLDNDWWDAFELELRNRRLIFGPSQAELTNAGKTQ